MTLTRAASFRVCDADLPGRAALASAGDLPAALEHVRRLHEQFRNQLAANGEGGSARLWQRLVVLEQQQDGRATPCHWSSSNGLRPRRIDVEL